MNWDQIQGKWLEYKGKAKQRWGKLTDQDLTVIDGKRDVLAGKILERTGATKERIEKEIVAFESACMSDGVKPGDCKPAATGAKAAVTKP